jgi:hypothetical protein
MHASGFTETRTRQSRACSNLSHLHSANKRINTYKAASRYLASEPHSSVRATSEPTMQGVTLQATNHPDLHSINLTVCSPGYSPPFTGSSACNRCPTGTYSPGFTSSPCAACPAGSTNSADGEASCSGLLICFALLHTGIYVCVSLGNLEEKTQYITIPNLTYLYVPAHSLQSRVRPF